MLARAKSNLVGEYAFVGIMKEMKLNFKILAKIFPSYFGAKDMPLDICNKCKVRLDGGTGRGGGRGGGGGGTSWFVCMLVEES